MTIFIRFVHLKGLVSVSAWPLCDVDMVEMNGLSWPLFVPDLAMTHVLWHNYILLQMSSILPHCKELPSERLQPAGLLDCVSWMLIGELSAPKAFAIILRAKSAGGSPKRWRVCIGLPVSLSLFILELFLPPQAGTPVNSWYHSVSRFRGFLQLWSGCKCVWCARASMSASNASLYIARRQFRDWMYFLLSFSIAAHQILISYETLCCHGGGIIMPMWTLPVAESTVKTSSQIISMWERAWRWRLSPRSPNCLNLNLRSFLCCSTNYPCTQLCGVSARRFGSIVPEHPLAGLHWKYLLASSDFFFFFIK